MQDAAIALVHLDLDVVRYIDAEFLLDRVVRIRHKLSAEFRIFGRAGDQLMLHFVRCLYDRLDQCTQFRLLIAGQGRES